MTVSYNGFKIEPAPLINFSREFSRTGNGDIIGTLYNIQANGYLVAYKGSPTSSGTFNTGSLPLPDEDIQDASRLGAILRKQKALCELFGPQNEYKLFEVQSRDGSQPIKFNPYNFSVSFQDGIWYEYCQYTISMLADSIFPFSSGFDNSYLESASETWSIEQDVENFPLNPTYINAIGYSYRISHSVSAKGKPCFNPEDGSLISGGMENAKNWALKRLEDFSRETVFHLIYPTNRSGSLFSPGRDVDYLYPCNQVRSESINNLENEYSVNENWIFASGQAIEECTIEKNIGEDGVTNVSIQGNILGLERRAPPFASGNFTSKFHQASGYFESIRNTLHRRCEHYAEMEEYKKNVDSLFPIPVSYSISKNPIAGTIGYNYQFSNKPRLVSGAFSETWSVSDTEYGKKVALIPVLGKDDGPVIQDLGTSEHLERTIDVQLVMGPSFNRSSYESVRSSSKFPYQKIKEYIDSLDPAEEGGYKSWKQSPRMTWDPINGVGSYSVTYIYRRLGEEE